MSMFMSMFMYIVMYMFMYMFMCMIIYIYICLCIAYVYAIYIYMCVCVQYVHMGDFGVSISNWSFEGPHYWSSLGPSGPTPTHPEAARYLYVYLCNGICTDMHTSAIKNIGMQGTFSSPKLHKRTFLSGPASISSSAVSCPYGQLQPPSISSI